MRQDQPLTAIRTGLTIEEVRRLFPMTREMGDNTRTRCLSFFCVTGDDLDPDVCSSVLRCVPMKAHRKGQMQRSGIPAPTGEWLIESGWHPCSSLEEEVVALLRKLPSMPPDADVFLRNFSLAVCVVFEIFSRNYPRLKLSSQIINQLVDVGAEFSIDWYDFSEYDTVPDDGETSVHATGVCFTTKSNAPLSCEVNGVVDASLETTVQAVIAGLSKLSASEGAILRTTITVDIEVHNEDVPLLVLPLSLLKALKNYKASLEIQWGVCMELERLPDQAAEED